MPRQLWSAILERRRITWRRGAQGQLNLPCAQPAAMPRRQRQLLLRPDAIRNPLRNPWQ
jgi:hypothetical protein